MVIEVMMTKTAVEIGSKIPSALKKWQQLLAPTCPAMNLSSLKMEVALMVFGDGSVVVVAVVAV